MQQIYVTEPNAIDSSVARAALGAAPYQLVPGDVHFSGGPHTAVQTLLIRSATTVDDTILQHFPHLESVIRVGVGLDNVDLDFCRQHNIAVFNAPGANAEAVSDYVVGMILHARRKLHLLSQDDARSWNRFKFMGENIGEQTVGIVGFGNIGRLLYKKLRGFGCAEFLLYDPYLPADMALPEGARMVPLDELWRHSDVISLHLPLTDETKHMVNTEVLRSLKDDALLINAARGGIVDEEALLQVAANKLLTYVADTVENEPQVNEKLLHNEHIIVTPHIASLTHASERNMIRIALERFLAGQAVKL